MTRIDGGEHAGWGTAAAGRRTVRSLYFQVQDQEIATPESFDIRLYPEDPFNPGFPDLAAGVTYAVGVSGPSGTSGIAAAAVVRPPDVPGVGDSVPIRGGGDVFVSFVLVASPSWPADGVSIQIVLGYQPSPTFTVWDTPGLAQGNTPPPPGSPQNSHGLSRTGAGAAVYNTRRNQLIDVAHDTAGGTTLAITNQPQLVGSHNPPPAGFGPAPGTADFLSGSNPDVVGGNPGRIDDIAMEFWKTGIGSGALVFFLMDFSATFGPELPVASFTSGTGVLCLHLASMQTVGVGLTMANEAWLVTAVPGSLRNGLAGMSVKQQAAALDPVTGAVHASPCRSQVF
jgi:hypothetical protein